MRRNVPSGGRKHERPPSFFGCTRGSRQKGPGKCGPKTEKRPVAASSVLYQTLVTVRKESVNFFKQKVLCLCACGWESRKLSESDKEGRKKGDKKDDEFLCVRNMSVRKFHELVCMLTWVWGLIARPFELASGNEIQAFLLL